LAHGERDPERRLTNRNGYRDRRWDTRVGSIDLAIPRVRDGSYFPSLLEPRRRAERALLAVIQEAYVLGVSTRRVDDLVRTLWHRLDQQERGIPDLCRPRRRGRRVPLPVAQRRGLSLRLARRRPSARRGSRLGGVAQEALFPSVTRGRADGWTTLNGVRGSVAALVVGSVAALVVGRLDIRRRRAVA